MNYFLPSRSSGFPQLQFGPKNPGCDPNNLRQRGALQAQHFNTIHIHTAMLTPPFLQYSALTPGQKQYLCRVCEVYNEDHMRELMKQHYLNVLHRSIGTDPIFNKKSSFTVNPVIRTSLLGLDHSPAGHDEGHGQKIKGQEPKSTSPETKTTGLPDINSHRRRVSRIKHKETKTKTKMRKSSQSMEPMKR